MRHTLFRVVPAFPVWLVASEVSGGIVRPKLLTGSDAEVLSKGVSDAGPSFWLLGLAAMITLATLSWWAWWAYRYHSAAMTDSERAFRRLARVVGLTRTDRESLRALCQRAGVDPLAALGSSSLAALALEVEGVPNRRRERLRSMLCDTSHGPAGRKVA
jgi:hypothetical protein